MKNTKAQELAITSIDRNVAVNAGAGTGKTKVLTERYIHILEHGNLKANNEVESIVAITFTKKATQEMKERIREEIKNKFPLDGKWRKYYNDMEKANISTIHSLCGNILRDNALEANIDPMFSVLDADKADSLLEETILDFILKKIESDESMVSMIKLLTGDNIGRFAEGIKSIYYKIRTVGYSFEEVKKMTLDSIDAIEVDLGELEYIKDTLDYLMENSRKNSKLYKLKDNSNWEKFYKNEYLEDELVGILEFLYSNIGNNKKEAERIENLEEAINRVLLIKEKENKWLYSNLLDLLIGLDQEFKKEKEELGALDYDDLQILVLELLNNKEVRKKYQEKFQYIMVDEFQDTNELQKKIFYKLCSKEKPLDRNNLFIVGDPKQSIYGFRGADLEVFYDVMKDIEETSGKETISLDKNFRTVDTIIEFVNDIFGKLMESKYDPLFNHHVSKNDLDVEVLEKEDLEIPEGMKAGEYNAFYESELVASRIKELVYSGSYDYKDFCLLFRSTTNDHLYEDAFKKYGIPYYNVGGKGFYDCQEIVDLMNGLKAISNPYDTIASIGFLRSPMIGLSDKTIYWLLRNKEETLLETLGKDIDDIEEDEKEKLLTGKKVLSQLVSSKAMYRTSELIRSLLDKTHYLEVLLLNHNGKQGVSNIYKFLEISRSYDEGTRGTLEEFIDHIEKEKEKNKDESQAKIESENSNVVRLMTIHKSKGLQFPVVVVPQMAGSFNYQQDPILFHKDRGIGLRYDDLSVFYNNMKDEARKKDEEENQRILYVAMTRAEERLIIGNQGRNTGFKKMVNKLLDLNKAKYISEINFEKDAEKTLKTIGKELLQIKEFNQEEFPLIREVPGYNKKSFPSFNVSQYIDFKQCRRQFFMAHYKELPLDHSLKASEETLEGKSYAVKPMTRGNIVHEFSEYYREGVEPRKLIEEIVESHGLAYKEEVEKELAPYIENYLKSYSEDYDKYYVEKSFYLKVKDNYINGIIDRINIKDGKAEILDFKTNRVDNIRELVDFYTPQLQLYALAFEKISDLEVSRASILFLESGELVEIDTSRESLEENFKDIESFIDFVNNHSKVEEYEKSNDCRSFCKYNSLCNLD